MWKKFSVVFIVAVLLVGMLGTSVSANALPDQASKNAKENMSNEQKQVANAIRGNIQFNPKMQKFEVKETSDLAKDLAGKGVGVGKVKKDIQTINKSIKASSSGGVSTMDAGCTALSIFGFAHPISLEAAALALGVSGGVALAVAGSLGLIYLGGNIMCPYMT